MRALLLLVFALSLDTPAARSSVSPEALLALDKADLDAPFPRFIHIPKCAGRSITIAAHQKPFTRTEARGMTRRYVPRCPLHHVPPAFFTEFNPYERLFKGAATFCITRHPFDRALSEFRMRNKKHPENYHGTAELNKQLQHFAARVLGPTGADGGNCMSEMERQATCGSECHLLPQFLYIFPNGTATGPRTCTHVLRYETLEEDWHRLVSAYVRPGVSENSPKGQVRMILPHISSQKRPRENITQEGLEGSEQGLGLLPNIRPRKERRRNRRERERPTSPRRHLQDATELLNIDDQHMLTIANISLATRRRLFEAYRVDFRLFGYGFSFGFRVSSSASPPPAPV